jgi:hypothetical protein
MVDLHQTMRFSMRHDDLDERLRQLGVNVGPFTFTVLFLIGVAAAIGIGWFLY